MSQLLRYLPLLGCPIGMGLIMWMMSSGKKSNTPTDTATQKSTNGSTSSHAAEMDQLRAELAELRASEPALSDPSSSDPARTPS